MSKSSAKKTSRAAKSARVSVKKSAKLPRALAKKAKPLARVSVKGRLAVPSRSSKGTEKIIRTASPPVQPVAASQPILLRSHKYHVGDVVYYTSPSFGRAAATGSYTVIKQLPSEGDDYQYRIKNTEEAFERVAKESQLDRE
jgi:hypothetical protein